MKNSKIKKRGKERSKINTSFLKQEEIDYPIFCFKHLKLNFKNDYKFYFQFVDRLSKLCNSTWKQINTSQKHGFGTEKLPISKIKPEIPKFISPEVKHLLVFRANGDNRPFLGIRRGNVFHIIFIEERFGDVYNH